MKTRRLGRTNLEVSALGVGGHVYPIGNSSDDFCTPDDRATLIKHLVDAGVNYFDTTWMNEVELLADSLSRAQITAPLQVSLQLVDGVSDSKWREKLRPELERRLEIMGYSRAPLFIMGVGNGHPKPGEIRAAAHAMQGLQSEGLIQNIGLSCHDFAAFDTIADIIEEDDCLDYLMIRYNWKFPRAAERLFPVARSKDVGLVAMKALCWDCGIEDWARRISVFEPLDEAGRAPHFAKFNAAQNSLLWCLEACDTSAVSINARWEADQLLQATSAENIEIDTGDFARFRNRLHDKSSLLELSQRAESAIIRERSASLL